MNIQIKDYLIVRWFIFTSKLFVEKVVVEIWEFSFQRLYTNSNTVTIVNNSKYKNSLHLE